jgi:hypothetical protein
MPMDQNLLQFSPLNLGSIIAPFIIGLIADRYFNAEKILGILHLAGAMYQMYQSEEVGFLHLCFKLHDFIYAYFGSCKFSFF